MIRARITKNLIPEYRARLQRNSAAAVQKAVSDIEAETKRRMSDSKTGRIYGNHQASAPGEAPAVDSGGLFNSIEGVMTAPLSGIVFTDKEYAPVLEFGGAKMEARPIFGPVAEEVGQQLTDAMEQVLDG
jgi:hypothetical protein